MAKRQSNTSSFERSLKPKLGSGYKFASHLPRDMRAKAPAYTVDIRQHAENARVCSFKEKVDRRPIDPPPIIQLYTDEVDKSEFLQSTSLFMTATLINPHGSLEEVYSQRNVRATAGITVQTPTKLKDEHGKGKDNGSFCIWNHISVRQEGHFKLHFRLFERRNLDVIEVASAISNVFTVHNPKNFPGMSESSYLTRCLASQGVRIRVRNENKAIRNRIYEHESESTSLAPSTSTMSTSSASSSKTHRVQKQQPTSKIQQTSHPIVPLGSLATMPFFPTPLHESHISQFDRIPFTNPNVGFKSSSTESDRKSQISQLPRPLPPGRTISANVDPLNSVSQLNQQHQQQSKASIDYLLDAARTLNDDEEREDRARRFQL
ncbi:hypothetical protein J056_002765 [Wallemia ichthyophaga EXF-994]|uniref:Velvet domain-containing protein n=1 Tax=Wallemia ichthyophaga (strain EXF-994 / CBS 113033) TaxID=1299270 RepID=R9A9N2_WALI9|nr:uncharacterized protein J056_002765 [Wallemia ichthyophaga EXF-994]TIA95354.1 hypothetical protein E3P95_03741 [Wallemia ichthyophaga]EOQ98812.1 hypothetical protein J056_002765 [Wallemia ichthyophaga EXF-994]TIA96328.1 hypothetical protein E3P94_03737 [Wallemia ichthyophaga]TIB29197.1 hypothetical protein E3P84_03788 [Wallemia ichthyophaga]TIB38828.1 hypothetical protein E3P83_03794 [Wallemia ichthyophaga]